MAFKDTYPLELEFEIDRKRLEHYYQFQSVVGCFAISVPFGILVVIGFLQSFLLIHPEFTALQKFVSFACFVVGGLVVGLLVGMFFYYGYFNKSSKLAARNLRLRVEGPYLRLITGAYFVIDRRYHFKDIHTYTTCQGPLLKRFGMKALMFNVSMRQMHPVQIDGLIDVDSVRDKLCEIDAAREFPKDYT